MMAENLHHLGHTITVVEMNNQILAPLDFPIAAIAQQHLREKGLELMLNTAVESFEDKGETLLVNFKGGMQMEVDYVILSIGVRPDTRLAAAAGLQIGEARGIVVNEYLQTTHPDIYAVGDAIEFKHPITKKIGNTFFYRRQDHFHLHRLVHFRQRMQQGAYGRFFIFNDYEIVLYRDRMIPDHYLFDTIFFKTDP